MEACAVTVFPRTQRFEAVAERRGHPAVLKVLVHIEAVEIAACVDVTKADDLSACERHQRNVLRQ